MPRLASRRAAARVYPCSQARQARSHRERSALYAIPPDAHRGAQRIRARYRRRLVERDGERRGPSLPRVRALRRKQMCSPCSISRQDSRARLPSRARRALSSDSMSQVASSGLLGALSPPRDGGRARPRHLLGARDGSLAAGEGLPSWPPRTAADPSAGTPRGAARGPLRAEGGEIMAPPRGWLTRRAARSRWL